MRFSTGLRNAQADIIETTIGASAKLQIRTGAPPTNVGDAAAGTELAEITCPADYFAAAAAGAIAKSGTWSAVAAANGLAAHFRMITNDEATPHIDGLVSMPHAVSTAVQVGQQMHNAGNVYRCDTAGTTGAASPPTGTGANIVDGSAQWDYVGPVDVTIDNVDVAIGQTVTVNTFGLTIPE